MAQAVKNWHTRASGFSEFLVLRMSLAIALTNFDTSSYNMVALSTQSVLKDQKAGGHFLLFDGLIFLGKHLAGALLLGLRI